MSSIHTWLTWFSSRLLISRDFGKTLGREENLGRHRLCCILHLCRLGTRAVTEVVAAAKVVLVEVEIEVEAI